MSISILSQLLMKSVGWERPQARPLLATVGKVDDGCKMQKVNTWLRAHFDAHKNK